MSEYSKIYGGPKDQEGHLNQGTESCTINTVCYTLLMDNNLYYYTSHVIILLIICYMNIHCMLRQLFLDCLSPYSDFKPTSFV